MQDSVREPWVLFVTGFVLPASGQVALGDLPKSQGAEHYL